MLKPGGYVCESVDGKIIREADSFTCNHCSRMVEVPYKQDPAKLGGFCGGCGKLVCSGCVGKGCRPIEKWLEEQEASYHARRSYGV